MAASLVTLPRVDVVQVFLRLKVDLIPLFLRILHRQASKSARNSTTQWQLMRHFFLNSDQIYRVIWLQWICQRLHTQLVACEASRRGKWLGYGEEVFVSSGIAGIGDKV